MSQLSNYIHSELSSLLREVQRTPPKKHSSLAKIEALVRTAPLAKSEKKKLKEEIKQVQSAIVVARTPLKSTRKSPQKIPYQNPNSVIQLSEDHDTVQSFLKAKLRNAPEEVDRIVLLKRQYEELRMVRESKEKYLKELIVKVQRLERIGKTRARSAEGRRQEIQLNRQYEQKKRKLKEVKMSTLGAVREGRKEAVKDLMQAYYCGVDKKSRM